jgi:ribonucleoside-diphosphate reductase alpha chain
MYSAIRDTDFSTKSIRDGSVVTTYKAKDLLKKIAEATWQCGDPGMQFDTTVNRWHTSKNTARINASNPCSEYMFLDDSACNLASLNLLKFAPNGAFDVEAYRHAVDILITAQEILVDNAGYPTESISRNSHDYRPLGLGYANLGALLMASGLPYDSDAGRDYAACVTAIMCGEAYLQSARIAELCPQLAPASSRVSPQDVAGGACPGWYINREPFLNVIRMHRASVNKINKENVPTALLEGSRQSWDEALALGEKHGYRNAQVTVLAPTGTIGFMMDCDTTGVEPDLALVKYKKLVGGGMIKIVNQTVPSALWKLGYTPDQVNSIVSYIDSTGTIEGAPGIKDEHLPVFDCSFKPSKGTRSIHYMGHVMMMAATQPFISGAISKTVNLPEAATVEDITEAYLQSWKLGLKAVAIYRDGSKKAQPLMAASSRDEAAKRGTRGEKDITATQRPLSGTELEFQKLSPEQQAMALAAVRPLTTQEQESAPPRAVRHRLPGERASITHKFALAGHEGYITVGLYKDGTPGELFIRMAKEGSTVSGLMDSFATAISLALQHGVPMKLMCEKFSHTRFEPSGFTGNPEIPIAKSIMDYIFRWLELRFVTGRQYPLFKDMVLPPMGAATGSDPLAASQSSVDDNVNRAGLETTPPQGGVASSQKLAASSSPTIVDRGLYHSADALKEFVDLGDAPSCHVCGAIMTRNGSCYRCMSCGSTSGCS